MRNQEKQFKTLLEVEEHNYLLSFDDARLKSITKNQKQ
jgi:hypothetical protein